MNNIMPFRVTASKILLGGYEAGWKIEDWNIGSQEGFPDIYVNRGARNSGGSRTTSGKSPVAYTLWDSNSKRLMFASQSDPYLQKIQPSDEMTDKEFRSLLDTLKEAHAELAAIIEQMGMIDNRKYTFTITGFSCEESVE